VRAALNAVFGEVAAAARRVDARRLLLGDAAELVIDAIALFRDARDGAVASLAGGAAEYASLPAAAREALLVAELDAAGNLHPALRAPAPTPGGRTGHYAVLRRVAEGVCAAALDRRDFDNPVLRPVARELLTSAVLRPLVGLFAPHSARRLLLAALARAGAVDAATLPPGVLGPPPPPPGGGVWRAPPPPPRPGAARGAGGGGGAFWGWGGGGGPWGGGGGAWGLGGWGLGAWG